MYNLLMTGNSDRDVWRESQGRSCNVDFLRGRMFEYTDQDIKSQFSPFGTPAFEALMALPCLFTYEGLDVAGVIGRIIEVRYEERIFEITYALPTVYPTIRIVSEAAFETLGIEVGRSWERSRNHWAVKDVDLFEATTRLLHDGSQAPVILSDRELRNVWGDDYRRRILVFLSHSARYSREAAAVKAQLEQQGRISCFLAHRNVTPSTVWQEEISKALNTMDIFVGLVTDDFHRGGWIDQEIGCAVQRGTFRVFAKLGGQDPQGMVAREQALIANWEAAPEAIVAHLRREGKLGR